MSSITNLDLRYLTLPQVAAEIQTTVRTVQRYIQDGKLPAIRLSKKKTLVDRKDFEAYMRRQRT